MASCLPDVLSFKIYWNVSSNFIEIMNKQPMLKLFFIAIVSSSRDLRQGVLFRVNMILLRDDECGRKLAWEVLSD